MKGILWIVVIFWTLAIYNPNTNAIGVDVTSEAVPYATEGYSTVGLFYDALRPYGEWIWMQPYGLCWYPYNMPIDWQPYTDGQWIYTDCGWTWFSDLPWGWACFHYGTWDYDDTYGWLWCPRTIWAPAWVVWRCGDGWIGWAPCSSRLRWRAGLGFELRGVDLDDIYPRNRFCFVDIDHFADENLSRRILPFARSVTAFNETKASVDLNIERGRIFNTLPVQETLVKRLGHPIQEVKLVDSDTITFRRPPVKENQIPVFRPDAKSLARMHNQIMETMIKESKVPPELMRRQAEQSKALQQQQATRMKQLENIQRQEVKLRPNNITPEQLQIQHEQERAALQQQMQREQQVLQNWHQYERRVSPPTIEKPQRFFIPSQPSRPMEATPRTENRGGGEISLPGGRGR